MTPLYANDMLFRKLSILHYFDT